MTSSNHRASSVMIHLSDRESDGQFVEARFENRTGDKTALGEERIFFFSIIFFSRIRAKLFYDYSLFYCYKNLQRTIKKTFREPKLSSSVDKKVRFFIEPHLDTGEIIDPGD